MPSKKTRKEQAKVVRKGKPMSNPYSPMNTESIRGRGTARTKAKKMGSKRKK